jgi:phage baseplate assembly protein W
MSIKEIDLNPDKQFGIGFPLNYDRESYGFFKQNQTYYHQLQDNIKNLIMTKIGERPGNVRFGCRIHEVIFEQNEPGILKTKIEESIKEALFNWMPHVQLIQTRVRANNNTLSVSAQFRSDFNEGVIDQVLEFNEGFIESGDTSDNTTTGGTGGGY